MRYTKVREVMTSEVVIARETTPYKTLVELLSAHRISFLPIVDDADRLVGVVSESDLLAKQTDPDAEAHRPLLERRRHRITREKASGTIAADLMTRDPETVAPWASVTGAAKRMHDRNVKHLPVVDKTGHVVGVVSRGDVLRVFLRSDDEIRREILDDVVRGELLLTPWDVEVEVRNGIVTIRGQLEYRGMVGTLLSAVRAVEGVTHVRDHLTWKVDDLQNLGRRYAMYTS